MKNKELVQESEAMNQLINELNIGIHSAEESGWVSEEDFNSYFQGRDNNAH